MAKISFTFLLLLSIISMANAIEPRNTALKQQQQSRRFKAFIESECRNTRYFKLCVHCLSTFANPKTKSPQQLAQVALSVSLVRARLARAYVTKIAEDLKQKKTKDYRAVQECLAQINDGVCQLTNSVKELRRMSPLASKNEFNWHQSNIQSWMSTALTDALMCMDGISGHAMGSKVKATIRAKVLNFAQVTSNALAFFDRYVARHRASSPTKP